VWIAGGDRDLDAADRRPLCRVQRRRPERRAAGVEVLHAQGRHGQSLHFLVGGKRLTDLCCDWHRSEATRPFVHSRIDDVDLANSGVRIAVDPVAFNRRIVVGVAEEPDFLGRRPFQGRPSEAVTRHPQAAGGPVQHQPSVVLLPGVLLGNGPRLERSFEPGKDTPGGNCQ